MPHPASHEREEHFLAPTDFFARRGHYFDHIAPIWKALSDEQKGIFFVPKTLEAYAERAGVNAFALKGIVNTSLEVSPSGTCPLLTSAYGDMLIAVQRGSKRQHIFMEHGVGLSFPHPGYAGGKGGVRDKVSLFLNPNSHVAEKNAAVYPHIPQVIIGTPKLDHWANYEIPRARNPKPIVCISFHWMGNASPEAGNAFRYYAKTLNELARRNDIQLVGHGHPKIIDELRPIYQNLHIEVIETFDEVMRRADVYVNDCSSTMYEFLVTGKPVVILNGPHFRRNINYGIRFWEYTDIGYQVNEPHDLLPTIMDTLEHPGEHDDQRRAAVSSLYPYLGSAATHAADAIQDFSKSSDLSGKKINAVQGDSVGIMYMAFGKKAAAGAKESINSLRALGIEMPVVVVGDAPIPSTKFIEWKGNSPFDPSAPHNFRFRAGRVKPHMYALSPFDRTLLIDADTEFISSPMLGFEILSSYDLAIAEEKLKIGQLYNTKNAGWEINIQERDLTIDELGGNKSMPFLNTGVIFFKKGEAVKTLFERWYSEWLRFKQWDEQLSFMRAIGGLDISYKTLPIDWNHPHKHLAKVIFHNYGRGVVRTNG